MSTQAAQRTRTTVAAPTRERRARRRLAVRDVLTIAVWTTAALSIVLYLAGGTVSFSTPGDAATTLGIVAGLLGTDFVLLMLVLAARIPLIDRTVGHDRAIALHRRLGKPAFFLLLAHGALLTIGYALSDGVNVVGETAALLGSPDMPLAYVSLALFVAVIVTSLVAVKRRFPHEFWYAVHLLSYAAVLTALPHQFSTGSVLMSGTWQRVYWIALYVIAVGSIATFRLAEPVIQSLRHRIVVERVERIAPDAISIHLRGRGLDRLGAEGGQFFHWRFWAAATWWHVHPISLSAHPTSRTARITVREAGAGTRRWASVAPGTRVSFEGPYGVFTETVRERERVVVLAAGIGVTPARALLERIDAGPGLVTVLVRASDDDSLYLFDEVRSLCRDRGWTVYSSVGQRAVGARGWLAGADAQRGVTMQSIAPALADSEVYICGSDAWADLVEAEAVRLDVPEHNIHRERFDW